MVLSEKVLTALKAAFDDRDRLAAGWVPPAELWVHAPVLHRWFQGPDPVSGTMAIFGLSDGVKRRSDPVVAMETGPGGIGWARTLSGWHRLAMAKDEAHASGRHLVPAEAREIEIAARRAGYKAPCHSLQPSGPLVLDSVWEKVARHFETTSEDAETAIAVFYARLRDVGLKEARMMVGGWMAAREFDLEIV
ncbi:hypothetical protein FV226_12255 [Methylobacterium sp. WL12]|nr:hypothetical protein FV226_12255 [Methylobacterium sp. WL12]